MPINGIDPLKSATTHGTVQWIKRPSRDGILRTASLCYERLAVIFNYRLQGKIVTGFTRPTISKSGPRGRFEIPLGGRKRTYMSLNGMFISIITTVQKRFWLLFQHSERKSAGLVTRLG